MLFACPEPTALSAIPIQACSFKLDQVVRLAFQRRQTSAAPSFATLSDIQTLANWQSKLAANDVTKIVVTPLFAGMVIPQSTAITTGGNDNSTIGGITEYHGEGFVTVTGVLKNLTATVKRALDKLISESIPGSTGRSKLTAFMFNQFGYSFQSNLINSDESATTKYNGFEIFNLRFSSLGSEGLNAPNTHAFSFEMKADWADTISSVKPNFDPLVDLVVASAPPTLGKSLSMTAGSMNDADDFITVNAAVDGTHSFKWNDNSDGSGSNTTMNIMIGGVQVAQVVYTNDRNGQNAGWVAGGVTYYGTFGPGNRIFAA